MIMWVSYKRSLNKKDLVVSGIFRIFEYINEDIGKDPPILNGSNINKNLLVYEVNHSKLWLLSQKKQLLSVVTFTKQ
jgi:hypothetical protein